MRYDALLRARNATPLGRRLLLLPLLPARPRRSAMERAGSDALGGAHVSVPYTELEAGLKKLEQLPAPRYVVFTADPDPATGLPWCPDCVRAVPAVRRTMAAQGAALLEVGVGQRGDWKGNTGHPCRTDARFQVSGVPTLVHWPGGGAPCAKLGPELENAATPEAAVAQVAKFILDTK